MQDQVRRRAYELWEADGCRQGQDQLYWFKALAELACPPVELAAKSPRKRGPRLRKAA